MALAALDEQRQAAAEAERRQAQQQQALEVQQDIGGARMGNRNKMRVVNLAGLREEVAEILTFSAMFSVVFVFPYVSTDRFVRSIHPK